MTEKCDLPSKCEDFHDYVVFKDIRIPMRDGVTLSASIIFPSKHGEVDFNNKYPVMLNRTAYAGVNGELTTVPTYMAHYAAERGYVFIINASRGTYLSEGILEPMVNEGPDGVDTVEWIVRQPWCNGKVATMGMSWLGGTQYALQLMGDVPGLETSVIACPAMNSIDGGWVYNGEFFDTSCAAAWAILIAKDQCLYHHLPDAVIKAIMNDNALIGDPMHNPSNLNMTKLLTEHKLRDIPIARHMPFYQRWLDNRDNPEFFAYNSTKNHKHDMKKPLVFMGGWYDLFNMNVLDGFRKAVRDAPSEEISNSHRLIVGHWGHNFNPLVRMFPEGESDARLFTMEWVEQQLKGVPSRFFAESPVTLFVMGENRWRSEKQWPLTDEVRTKFYLHSHGDANSSMGRGELSLIAPDCEEKSDQYISNPDDPVFSPGGHGLMYCGQADQRKTELRQDVLVYTTQPLNEDLEVTGYINAILYADTSATDTDFIMKLVDVCPDGIAYNVVTGGRRGRYLKHGRNAPEALTPGELLEVKIQLKATSYVFKKGHCIRVDICGSDFLNTDLNPNSFSDISSAEKTDYIVSTQNIYHDRERPSMIELPIIPASHERKWIEEWPFRAELTGIDFRKSVAPRYAHNVFPPKEKDKSFFPTE